MSYDEAMESYFLAKELAKVANCICLFGLHHGCISDRYACNDFWANIIVTVFFFDFERYKGCGRNYPAVFVLF